MGKLAVVDKINYLFLFLFEWRGHMLICSCSGTTFPFGINALHPKNGLSEQQCSSIHVISCPPSWPTRDLSHSGILQSLQQKDVFRVVPNVPCWLMYRRQIKQAAVIGLPTLVFLLSIWHWVGAVHVFPFSSRILSNNTFLLALRHGCLYVHGRKFPQIMSVKHMIRRLSMSSWSLPSILISWYR